MRYADLPIGINHHVHYHHVYCQPVQIQIANYQHLFLFEFPAFEQNQQTLSFHKL